MKEKRGTSHAGQGCGNFGRDEAALSDANQDDAPGRAFQKLDRAPEGISKLFPHLKQCVAFARQYLATDMKWIQLVRRRPARKLLGRAAHRGAPPRSSR